MKRALFIYVLIIVSLSSCEDSVQEKITGNWAIDEFYLGGKQVNALLLSNIMTFYDDGTCGLPITEIKQSEYGDWTVYQGNKMNKLKIDISNNPFNGEYNFHFKKDYDRKLFILILKNDYKEIQASKMMYDW